MESDQIIALRKELHQNPELSGQEFETARRIRRFIEEHNPTNIIENIGGSGLAVVYDFPLDGPTVTIRCELDALPIQEENEFRHRSTVNGISHKCGHDGHMAIVAGLIFWIKEQTFSSGKIVLLFQPSEENGKGAERIMNDEKFRALQTDYIFALHNIPQQPMNAIITMDFGFSAEVQSFIVTLKGKESHAADPDNGINPSLGIAEILSNLSKLNNNDPLAENFAVLTPVHITMGQKAYGISPADGELHYTIRTWESEKMTILKSKIVEALEAICTSHKLEYDIKWLEYFPTSRNNRESNSHVLRAARQNNFEIIEKSYPFRFGEDFGWFSKEYKTAMFGLGAGMDTPPLHNSFYDFPDEIIETGIDMFKTIIASVFLGGDC